MLGDSGRGVEGMPEESVEEEEPIESKEEEDIVLFSSALFGRTRSPIICK